MQMYNRFCSLLRDCVDEFRCRNEDLEGTVITGVFRISHVFRADGQASSDLYETNVGSRRSVSMLSNPSVDDEWGNEK